MSFTKMIHTELTKRQELCFMVLLFCLLSFALSYALINDKHLSCDGVHYFTIILDTADFTHIAWSRQFANYITQWPVVLAVRLNSVEMPFLKSMYAIGIYIPYVLTFIASIIALRGEYKAALVFQLLSLGAINLTSDAILTGEHQTMVLLIWPVLFILLRSSALRCLDALILLCCLTLLLRHYETVVIPSLLFIFLIAWRIYKYRRPQEYWMCAVAVILCLITIWVAAESILDPRDPTNRGSFLAEIFSSLKLYEAVMAIGIALFYFLLTITKQNRWLAAAIMVLSSYLILVFVLPQKISALESFNARTLSASLLPALMFSAIATQCLKGTTKYHVWVLVLPAVIFLSWASIKSTGTWTGFTHSIEQTVHSQPGFIKIEDTGLMNNPYHWHWTSTELGLVLGAPCTQGILLNRSDVHWQPFDPREHLALSRFIRAGVANCDNDLTRKRRSSTNR